MRRKLRIAWSVCWGVVAVLLCVLWVRSYWRSDRCLYADQTGVTYLISAAGRTLYLEQPGVDFGDEGYFFSTGECETVEDERASLEMMLSWEQGDTSGGSLAVVAGFSGGRILGGRAMMVPYWFPVSVIIPMAVLPWIRWTNRFSLRTLLIATTLVAVGLGLLVWLAAK